jgi:hypothetical protein
MGTYKIWVCLRCWATIAIRLGSNQDKDWKGHTWGEVAQDIMCCESPSLETQNLHIRLPDNEKEAEPKRFDRVELVLQDMVGE